MLAASISAASKPLSQFARIGNARSHRARCQQSY